MLETLSTKEAERLNRDWLSVARPDQLPPDILAKRTDWAVWLMLGGRGAGKTRAGAEWVRLLVQTHEEASMLPPRIALVGPSLIEARAVMVEGVSGLLAVHEGDDKPVFEPSKRQLTWPNGAIAQLFSAEEPEGLRGPQFTAAWCDELAKWRLVTQTWDMLQFALRLGDSPSTVITTTPRPVPLLCKLLEDKAVHVSRASTFDNAENLAPGFIERIRNQYENTLLGRQELYAELIEQDTRSLFSLRLIEASRVSETPHLVRTVVLLTRLSPALKAAIHAALSVPELIVGIMPTYLVMQQSVLRVRSSGQQKQSSNFIAGMPTD